MGHPLAARIKNGLDRFGIWSSKKAELVLNKTIESFYILYYPSVANISGYHVMVDAEQMKSRDQLRQVR